MCASARACACRAMLAYGSSPSTCPARCGGYMAGCTGEGNTGCGAENLPCVVGAYAGVCTRAGA